MNGALPQNLKPLFWSYNFENIDREKHKKLIIVQVINYGTLEEWKWLIETYRREKIGEIIEQIQASEFRPGALKLISLLLSLNKFSYAPRGGQ